MKQRVVSLIAIVALTAASSGLAKQQIADGFVFPAGHAPTVVILRPDVSVGLMDAGGIEEPNADWTASARANLAGALEKSQKDEGANVRTLGDQIGDDAKAVDAYQKLFRAVSAAIYLHKFMPGFGLPTKKDQFDWTLGPGAAKLGAISGADYALFLYTHDSYASAGRKTAQVAGLVGCALVHVCVIVSSGKHFYYASLVDLKSGAVVWFDYLPSADGDVRTPEGAQHLIDRLMSTVPTGHSKVASAR